MSRKLFPVFALLIVLSMVLAACGGGAAAPAEEAPAAEAPAAEEVAMPAAGSTLETVKARGNVICGGNASVPGFGFLDTEGNFAGFDIDFCKAVAAAVFGDAEKYEIRALSSQERFTALQSGEIDVLIRNTTWTLSRDTDLGANFTATTFYDGQGFIVRKADGIVPSKILKAARFAFRPAPPLKPTWLTRWLLVALATNRLFMKMLKLAGPLMKKAAATRTLLINLAWFLVRHYWLFPMTTSLWTRLSPKNRSALLFATATISGLISFNGPFLPPSSQKSTVSHLQMLATRWRALQRLVKNPSSVPKAIWDLSWVLTQTGLTMLFLKLVTTKRSTTATLALTL